MRFEKAVIPTTVPEQAINSMARYCDAEHDHVRFMIRWDEDDPNTPDWLVLSGRESGTPESWYYSNNPVASVRVSVPNSTTVTEWIEDQDYPNERYYRDMVANNILKVEIINRVEDDLRDIERSMRKGIEV